MLATVMTFLGIATQGGHGLGRRLTIGDVEDHRMGLTTGVGDGGHGLRRIHDIGADDRGAAAPEPLGDGPTDTPCGAGDHRDLSVEITHGSPVSVDVFVDTPTAHPARAAIVDSTDSAVPAA